MPILQSNIWILDKKAVKNRPLRSVCSARSSAAQAPGQRLIQAQVLTLAEQRFSPLQRLQRVDIGHHTGIVQIYKRYRINSFLRT